MAFVSAVAVLLTINTASSWIIISIVAATGLAAVLAIILQTRSNRRYTIASHSELRKTGRAQHLAAKEISRLKTDLETSVSLLLGRLLEVENHIDQLQDRSPKGVEPAEVKNVPALPSPVASNDAPQHLGNAWHVKAAPGSGPKDLVPVRGEPIEIAAPLRSAGRVVVDVELRSPSATPDAAALMMDATFVDSNGKTLHRDSDARMPIGYTPGSRSLVPLRVPESASGVRLRLQPGSSREYSLVNSIRLRETAMEADGSRTAKSVRVAMVADEFTFNSMRFECDAVRVHPNKWRAQFESHRPELFFCESAWAGTTPEREWRGKVYATNAWSHENRGVLIEILAYCRKQGIPTVFWNKEDPSHYYDRRHDFVKTALLFDHILTTDEECVARYRNEWGASSVGVLPFASQPRLYNPASTGKPRHLGAVFAGSWYANHLERTSAMTTILDGLIEGGIDLTIYDRYFGDSDPNHIFPEKYRSYTSPAIPHALLSRKYKEFEFGLNFNTETRSRSMFARRAFELAASGTIIVSNYSRGMDQCFGDLVVFPDRDPGRLLELTVAERTMMRHEAIDLVLKEHTYRERFGRVLAISGIDTSDGTRPIEYVATIDSLERGRARVNQHKRGNLTLIVGANVPSSQVQDYYREFSTDRVSVVASEFATREIGKKLKTSDLIRSNEIAPPEVEIRRAQLHRQYESGGIAMVGEREYVQGKTDVATAVLLPRGGEYATYLDFPSNVSAYRI